MQFFVGTSGYSYPKWKGSFYPEKLPNKEMLSYYAERFAAVEINNSFYRMPAQSDMKSWAGQVPNAFRFAFKAPQTITHRKRLKDADEPTSQFFHSLDVLNAKRGPVLFGLPPNFKKDLPRLEAFLRLIPKGVQAAFEFRHESWFAEDVFDCLRAGRCALCIADAEDLPPQKVIATASWGYIRLRREQYTDKSIAKWVEQLKSQAWTEAYVFFKHEETGTGPKFAARFLKQLDK
jgi:uncharacterized protein YecE (DUF72 family)